MTEQTRVCDLGNRHVGTPLNLYLVMPKSDRLHAKVTALSWAISIIGQRDSECIFPKKEGVLLKRTFLE